jgi:ketosteroid isomerase-like protein
MSNRYDELKQLGDKFLGVFNSADVDGIMSFFTEDAVYEELHGKINEGKAAIRKSFETLFSGRFGTIRFDEDDTFIDADANKVMSSWKLYLDLDEQPMVLAGLDLLYFEGNKITRKLTYVKAKTGLYEPA